MNENKNTIEKPMIIAYRECRDNLVATLNNSNLPAFVMELMLRELINEVSHNTQDEYNNAAYEYQKIVAEDNAKKKVESEEKDDSEK